MAENQTAGAWQRYWPTADVVLEFDALVAVVGRDGRGRMARSQYLQPGERFQYLLPTEAINDAR